MAIMYFAADSQTILQVLMIDFNLSIYFEHGSSSILLAD
jgi:hypothetical protein